MLFLFDFYKSPFLILVKMKRGDKMKRVYTEYDKGIPILKFTECSNCSMPYGEHSNNIINRGCCWYDAEFDIYDLKNLVDIDIDLLNNLLKKYTYKIKNSDLYYAIEFPAICYGKDNVKHNKVCIFFEKYKGCKLPIYAKPFICRTALCPQVRLYLLPEDYRQIRNFISKVYRHRLMAIEEIKQKLNFSSIKPDNIYEVINVLKSISPLKPIDEIRINILVKNKN